MKAKITATFERERFNRWLGNLIRTGKRSASVVCQQQFRLLISEAFKLTPPMMEKTFARGAMAGRAKIKSDLSKAFKVARETTVVRAAKNGMGYPPGHLSEALKWYRSIQNSKKRPRVNEAERRLITALDIRKLFIIIELRMGITAAGWVKAARELSVKPFPPDWIVRHASKNAGTFSIKTENNTLNIVAKNPSRHPSSGAIQHTLNRAFRNRASKIENQLMKALEKGKVDESAIDWGTRI